jgi:hypothetical protein
MEARGLGHFGVGGVPLPAGGLSPRPVTRQVFSWLRGVCPLPLVIKGVGTQEDATAAVELGADALIVSNHGGRVLDCAPAAIESLAEVVACIGNRVEVYMDSGIRRGSDVLKALALGARAVAIGRPTTGVSPSTGRPGYMACWRCSAPSCQTRCGSAVKSRSRLSMRGCFERRCRLPRAMTV